MSKQEYKTMRVPKEAWEVANETKRDGETWGEFLQRCSNNPPEIREFVEKSSTSNSGTDVEQKLDRIEAAQRTVDLEATAINQIADEVEQRLR